MSVLSLLQWSFCLMYICMFSSIALDYFHINRKAVRGSSLVIPLCYRFMGRKIWKERQSTILPHALANLEQIGPHPHLLIFLPLFPRILWTLLVNLICCNKCRHVTVLTWTVCSRCLVQKDVRKGSHSQMKFSSKKTTAPGDDQRARCLAVGRVWV